MDDFLEKPELETLDYKPEYPCPDQQINDMYEKREKSDIEKLTSKSYKSHHFEQPNQNLIIITEIEGLLSQVNNKLYDLSPGDLTKYNAKVGEIRVELANAREEIDLFQKTTLHELRKAFE